MNATGTRSLRADVDRYNLLVGRMIALTSDPDAVTALESGAEFFQKSWFVCGEFNSCGIGVAHARMHESTAGSHATPRGLQSALTPSDAAGYTPLPPSQPPRPCEFVSGALASGGARDGPRPGRLPPPPGPLARPAAVRTRRLVAESAVRSRPRRAPGRRPGDLRRQPD